MGTTFAEILTQWAMQDIDDVNWARELSENPAGFFRAKSDTLIMSIPQFSRPPEMQAWLKFTSPMYDSYTATVDADKETGWTLDTGKTGYQLCSGFLIEKGAHGSEIFTPLQCEYDSETGSVTVNMAAPAGSEVDLDFYTDGAFERELDGDQKRILGLCVGYQWYARFANNWLNLQPKIHDKTFDIASESAHMTAVSARMKELRLDLDDALLRYEQNCYYRQRMTQSMMLHAPN